MYNNYYIFFILLIALFVSSALTPAQQTQVTTLTAQYKTNQKSGVDKLNSLIGKSCSLNCVTATMTNKVFGNDFKVVVARVDLKGKDLAAITKLKTDFTTFVNNLQTAKTLINNAKTDRQTVLNIYNDNDKGHVTAITALGDAIKGINSGITSCNSFMTAADRAITQLQQPAIKKRNTIPINLSQLVQRYI